MSAVLHSRKNPGRVEVQRCLDHEVIAGILRRDYFDDPIPRLSQRLLGTLARRWIASRSQVYLLTAHVDGAYAGFVFGHTLGPSFWRLFARTHPNHLPELLWTGLKMRFENKVKRGSGEPLNGSRPVGLASQVGALNVSTLPQPFAWAPAGSNTGIIPLVFVHENYRGRSVARHLLDQISQEMFRDGAKCVEAHIDLNNVSSARAFLKAGFEVSRMATDDFWARRIRQQDSQ
ncbi:MAG TPA: GNAT family N-acetyltransferase [Pyrinomonadaceae bacterium]|nr:GNAT family N-acetyltransferase [Pyrinomonadaceae bacterium]